MGDSGLLTQAETKRGSEQYWLFLERLEAIGVTTRQLADTVERDANIVEEIYKAATREDDELINELQREVARWRRVAETVSVFGEPSVGAINRDITNGLNEIRNGKEGMEGK